MKRYFSSSASDRRFSLARRFWNQIWTAIEMRLPSRQGKRCLLSLGFRWDSAKERIRPVQKSTGSVVRGISSPKLIVVLYWTVCEAFDHSYAFSRGRFSCPTNLSLFSMRSFVLRRAIPPTGEPEGSWGVGDVRRERIENGHGVPRRRWIGGFRWAVLAGRIG